MRVLQVKRSFDVLYSDCCSSEILSIIIACTHHSIYNLRKKTLSQLLPVSPWIYCVRCGSHTQDHDQHCEQKGPRRHQNDASLEDRQRVVVLGKEVIFVERNRRCYKGCADDNLNVFVEAIIDGIKRPTCKEHFCFCSCKLVVISSFNTATTKTLKEELNSGCKEQDRNKQGTSKM